jgi:hypothetical protein
MGTNYYVVKNKPTVHSPIHIGKSSIGWRFLFHKVTTYENYITDEPLNTFPQWENFLTEQTKNGNVVIMNEYDEIVELDYLLNLIKSKQSNNNPDNFNYYVDNVDGYRFSSDEFS